jgi:hypothetical protein
MWQPGKGLREVLEKGKKMKWSGRNRHPICIDTQSPIDKSKVSKLAPQSYESTIIIVFIPLLLPPDIL